MEVPIHGQFQVYSDGDLLYCDYSEGFNQAGVIAITQEILQAARPHRQWVLLQRPEPSAGITQDAIPIMYQGYLQLQEAGCLAVALVENSMFVRAGNFPKEGPLTMPIFIDKDEGLLLRRLESIANQHGLQFPNVIASPIRVAMHPF